MAIIESVRNYISQCPLLEDFGKIGVEFLPSEIGSFSIEEVPEQSVVETYINGDELRQFTFILASRFIYNDEARTNIENSSFYEKLENWIDEKNELGELPELDEGMTATSLKVETGGYLFNVANGMRDARYQIQLKLLYEYERK